MADRDPKRTQQQPPFEEPTQSHPGHERDMREKILKAARTLRARVDYQPGKAQLFGEDSREQAKAVFEQELKNYETKNPNLPPTCDAQKVKRAVK